MPEPDNRAEARCLMRGYAIAGAKRSGSSHLCALLNSTSLLGKPDEYFHSDRLSHESLRTPELAEATWNRIAVSAATPNGVFGLKIFHSHFDRRCMSVLHQRIAALPFVLLERQDSLAQAISLARALQTGSWSAHQPEQTSPCFEPALIASCRSSIAAELQSWEDFFARNGITPLRIMYEDLVANPTAKVAAIAELVGVDPARLPPLHSGKRVQRDGLSEQWQKRFLAGAAE